MESERLTLQEASRRGGYISVRCTLEPKIEKSIHTFAPVRLRVTVVAMVSVVEDEVRDRKVGTGLRLRRRVLFEGSETGSGVCPRAVDGLDGHAMLQHRCSSMSVSSVSNE